MIIITFLCHALIRVFLAKASLSFNLLQFLKSVNVYASNPAVSVAKDDLETLEVMILHYLTVRH